MKYGVYAIHDGVRDLYEGLFLYRTELEAVLDCETKIAQVPENRRRYYTVYRVGEYDLTRGTLIAYPSLKLVDVEFPKSEAQLKTKTGTEQQIIQEFVNNVSDL